MEERITKIFIDELKLQCDFSIYSASVMNEYLVKKTIDSDTFWYYIQGFLNSAANISKILFGTNKVKFKERSQLREMLCIGDDSPIKSRELRNDFEHYDERVENWHRTSERKIFIGKVIGPYESVQGVEYSDRFRGYDTVRNMITFRGHNFYVKPLIDEIVKLKKRIVELEMKMI